MQNIAVIVVTYNRKKLLLELINALLSQSFLSSHIFIIDNSSTDGTEYELSQTYSYCEKLTYLKLNENIGGAGGFKTGLQLAYDQDFDWCWLMDDDALPEIDALDNLIHSAVNPLTIYGSTALCQDQLCWPITINGNVIQSYKDLPPLASVEGVPFLGFFIHRKLVNLIGFPDADFFISGDDIEYCQRARKLGYGIIMVKESRINHPMPPRVVVNLTSRPFFLLLQAPWRRYYDIRNRLVIAKRHYGIKLYTSTLPGIFLRWALSLYYEKERLIQSKAFFLGIKDGLINRLGKNWDN